MGSAYLVLLVCCVCALPISNKHEGADTNKSTLAPVSTDLPCVVAWRGVENCVCECCSSDLGLEEWVQWCCLEKYCQCCGETAGLFTQSFQGCVRVCALWIKDNSKQGLCAIGMVLRGRPFCEFSRGWQLRQTLLSVLLVSAFVPRCTGCAFGDRVDCIISWRCQLWFASC
jgi:hypothetical protein